MGCSNSSAVEPLRTIDNTDQEGDGRIKKRFFKQRGSHKDRRGRAKKEPGVYRKQPKQSSEHEDFARAVQQQLRAQQPTEPGNLLPEEPRPLLQLVQVAAEENAATRGQQRREAAEDLARGAPRELQAARLRLLLPPDPVIRLVEPTAEDAGLRRRRRRKVREASLDDDLQPGGEKVGSSLTFPAARQDAAAGQHEAQDTEEQHVVVTHHSAINMDGTTRMGFPADYPDSDSDVASLHSRKAYDPHAQERDPDTDQEETVKDYRWRRVEWSRFIGLDYEEEAGEKWVVDRAMQMILSNDEAGPVVSDAMKAAISIQLEEDPEADSCASSASSDDSFGLGEAPYLKRRGKPRNLRCVDFLKALEEDRQYSIRRAQVKRDRAAAKEAKRAAAAASTSPAP